MTREHSGQPAPLLPPARWQMSAAGVPVPSVDATFPVTLTRSGAAQAQPEQPRGARNGTQTELSAALDKPSVSLPTPARAQGTPKPPRGTANPDSSSQKRAKKPGGDQHHQFGKAEVPLRRQKTGPRARRRTGLRQPGLGLGLGGQTDRN